MKPRGREHATDPALVRLTGASDDEVRLLFAGDFYGGNRTASLCHDDRYEELFNDLLPVLLDKDISVVNLESPLTTVDEPIVKNGPNLKAQPSCAGALRFGNFDVVTLANNHIMDHGERGLYETLDACGRHGIRCVGAGRNLEEAGRALILEVKGLRIAILNMAEDEFSIAGEASPGANPLDPVRNFYQIRDAALEADAVVAVVHGGNEMFPHPSPRMVRTYRYLADLGVSAVIGHHQHCAGGFEIHRGSPVFYGIGNFIFDVQGIEEGSWNLGYLVTLSLGKKGVSGFRLHPYRQSAEEPGAALLMGGELESFLGVIRGYSSAIADCGGMNALWSEFCKSRELFYLKQLMGLGRYEVALLKRGIGTRSILKKERMAGLLNYVRCQAHRDVAMEILQRKIVSGRNGR
jgi:hypothetical protein